MVGYLFLLDITKNNMTFIMQDQGERSSEEVNTIAEAIVFEKRFSSMKALSSGVEVRTISDDIDIREGI